MGIRKNKYFHVGLGTWCMVKYVIVFNFLIGERSLRWTAPLASKCYKKHLFRVKEVRTQPCQIPPGKYL